MLKIDRVRKIFYKRIDPIDLDVFLSKILKKEITFLHVHPEYQLTIKQLFRLFYYIWQRKRGYSVAAVTGHKNFFGLDYKVNKHTLIPRPATELMVEEVIKILCNNDLLIDIGTGSGCIPITILKKSAATIVSAYATDIDIKALCVARENAKTHGTKIQFLKGDLLSPLSKTKLPEHKRLIITANLPYLRPDQFSSEPSIQKEPYHALVAKNKGLALYERLILNLPKFIKDSKAVLFLEIDPTQTEEIKKIIYFHFPEAIIEIKNDLDNQDRLVVVNI